MAPTPFDVKSEVLEDGIRAFTVIGELDLDTAPALEQPLSGAIGESGDDSILIDLSGCEFIDSTGIAVIVRAWQRVEVEGEGELVLCCTNEQVQRLLKITGVESSISIHPGRDSALTALRG